jgi:2-polyprenyl-3-methyl-5-hydroxy-6-metoxy-1,4-benzoquinol methylase
VAGQDPIVHDLEIMDVARNYQAWIYSRFSPYLGRRIVECGAGIGNFTKLLLDRDIVVAVDSYGPCMERLRVRFSNDKQVVPVQMDIASPALVELKRYQPDTVVCINVLEHVEDDAAALARMAAILSPGGRLALLVPAFGWLCGSVDRIIGHYRRYNRRELRAKLTQAGFAVHELFFMNCVAVPMWFVNNRILKRTEHPIGQVMAFDKFVTPWLRPLEDLLHPPFGLSLIAVAQLPVRSAKEGE